MSVGKAFEIIVRVFGFRLVKFAISQVTLEEIGSNNIIHQLDISLAFLISFGEYFFLERLTFFFTILMPK